MGKEFELEMANLNYPCSISGKGKQWLEFQFEVAKHIEEYVVKQYGDYPDDMAEGFSVQDFKSNLMRYVGRIGSNARGEVEAKRDCLKIAHYACLLLAKIKKEEGE